MKDKDLITKIFNRLKITTIAMSYSRSKVKSIVEFLARTTNEHLIKCYLGGKNNKNWNHWIKDELTPWLNKIFSLKCKNNKNLWNP